MPEIVYSKIKIPVVILAGAPAEPEFASQFSIKNRAEIPIGGKTMIQRVIDALKGSKRAGDIHVIGDVSCEGAAKIIPPGDSMIDNLAAGLKSCAPEFGSRPVLVATSDIPLLTSEAVDDFIEQCGDLQCEFYYPVISKESNDEKYPGMKRTYAKLAEGTFTGGNIMILDSDFLATNGEVIQGIIAARKSVLGLARIIGIGTLFRVIIAQIGFPNVLTLASLEMTASRILNSRVKAVRTTFPEIGADVDKAEHVRFAEEAVSNVQRSTSNFQH